MLIRSGRDRGDGAAPSTRFLPLLACLALVGALCIPNASGAQSLPQLPHLPQLPVGQGQQSASSPSPGVVDPSVPPDRAVEPVVLTGANFPGWAVPANQTAKLPLTDLADCPPGSNTDNCQHNRYSNPEVDTGQGPAEGTPTRELLGYRWTGKKFVQIPFQVDEMFTRYLENDASGFAIYSGADQHTTYAYDREGFRYTKSDPSNPCLARADSPMAQDPVKGLDTNDELAFMSSDAGAQAPPSAKLPKGIDGVREVAIGDPSNGGATRYAYVMKAAAGGPKPAYNASNGYVRYARDSNADTFEKSESSYENYGNAAKGIVCDANGNVVIDPKTGQPAIERRRPRDY